MPLNAIATAPSRRQLIAMTAAAAAVPNMAAAQGAGQGPLTPLVTPPLAAFIAGSQSVTLPDETRELARRHILDTLASVVACRDLEPSTLARKFALAQSGDARRNAATILGTRQKAALIDAVFAGAMTGHGAEINDFIPSAFVQPGPSIVAATLALAEQRNKTGDQLIRAVVAGYEMAGRFPKSMGLANLRRYDLANHGVGPVFGVGAASASIMGLREDRISDVLTYCSQQAASSWQWLMDVEHIEKSFVFAGLGARAGLQAAVFAEGGFRGVRDNLDQPGGFFDSEKFRGAKSDADREYLIRDLGKVWYELPKTAYKRYPVGGPTQPAIKAILELLPSIDRKAVKSCRIEMPGRWQAFRDAAMPALNLRYLYSIILIDGRLDFVSAQSLDRMHNDAAVKALMTKIDVVHDPKQEVDPGEERRESARLILIEGNGKRHEVFVPYVVGFPSHPMSGEEVEVKAMELMAPRLGAARARRVVEACRGLDTMKRAGDLVTLIGT